MSEPSDDIRQLQEENELLRQRIERIEQGRRTRRRFGTWLAGKAGGAFAGSWLRNSFLQLYREIPERNIRKETLADVSASLLWRLTRLGVITILLALLPTAILIFQTNLLMRQNRLLERQNLRLDQQTNLAEAQRRNSLVYVMSSLLDEMDAEIQREGGRLTDVLIARIAGLTQSLKPYRFLENDALTEKALSPEKGQLFLNIVLAEMSRASRSALFKRANFGYSDLQGAELHLLRIGEVRMPYSRLGDARVFNTEWENADLTGTDLTNSWLEDGKFTQCFLTGIDATFSYWSGIRFGNCHLSGSTWENALLTDVDFYQTDLSGSRWDNAVLTGCTFGEGTDASTADWNGAIVPADWFAELAEQNPEMAGALEKAYRMGGEVDVREAFGNHPSIVRFTALYPDTEWRRLKVR